ncbi:MAG: hypothetical protein OXU20_09905 [Myxococcales bacterium]|nr:hypothetical protein [Myxococcales bacterium]
MGRASWNLPDTRRSLRVALTILPVGAALACGEGPTVVLGNREPARFRFGPPELVSELSVDAKTDNPTLTSDMLEIYFTSERNGGQADVFVASRPARSKPFGEIRRVDEVSTPGLETSPAISADGLTLWVASDRTDGQGSLDIWVAKRPSRNAPWSTPQNVEGLNSSGQDLPRPPGEHGRVMPMASDREMQPYYQVQFASRSAPTEAFGNPRSVSELSFPGESTVDAFLTDDGLTLFYVTGPAFGPADMYVAYRRSTSQPFEHHMPLDNLNSTQDERDPWLSPDGTELYFSSDRSGHYAIYVAAARRGPARLHSE